jgi:hypothetical protein
LWDDSWADHCEEAFVNIYLDSRQMSGHVWNSPKGCTDQRIYIHNRMLTAIIGNRDKSNSKILPHDTNKRSALRVELYMHSSTLASHSPHHQPNSPFPFYKPQNEPLLSSFLGDLTAGLGGVPLAGDGGRVVLDVSGLDGGPLVPVLCC